MIKKHRVIKLIMCFTLIFLLNINIRSVFAEGPSVQILGVSGKLKVIKSEFVAADGNTKGRVNIQIEGTDEKISTYWTPQNMLVSDCSFLEMGRIYRMGDSTTNKTFELNIDRNGTYGFYVFHNGNQLVGYVHYKVKGFPLDDIAEGDINSGKFSKMSKEQAEYYGLSWTEGETKDFDGATNGICVNQNNEEDKPSGGKYEENKEEDKKDNKDYMKEFMDKLNEIGNKIPPAPNWDKITDAIGDKVGSKIGDVLGKVTDPPPIPSIPDMPGIDTGGLEKERPDFKENPDLDKNGFTGDDIKKDAPKIEEKKDETGGFDIGDPMKNIPDAPKEPPKPGETEKSGWTQDKPKEPEQPKIPDPKENETPNPSEFPKPKPNNDKPPKPNTGDGKPPIPNQGNDKPPIPNQGNDKPPSPNDGNGKPPSPSGGDYDFGNYKRHPDDPDGSG